MAILEILRRYPIQVQVAVTSFIFFMSFECFAQQKQLVLLRREEVIHRYYPGDEFIFKLKGSDRIISSYVNNLSDTAVVIHRDTIPFHRIERTYVLQHSFRNTIGAFLVVGGAGYFLIDQFNTLVVHGESASLDQNVNRVAVPALVVGLPLMLIKKRSQKLGYKFRLLSVKEGSPFYRPDTRGRDGSWYIDGQ